MKTLRIISELLFAVALPIGCAACGPSLGTLQVQAEAGQVQDDAPLHARQSITIDAGREAVWAVLTDIDSWPSWQKTVSEAHGPAVLRPGEVFTWTNDGSDITSTLARVVPNEEIVWTGSVSLAKAIHVWRLSEVAPDKTRVDVEETMDGLALSWFYGQDDLDADMTRSLQALRVAAERRARNR